MENLTFDASPCLWVAGATLAFTFESYDGLMLVMFMMGTQSALFGPSKYGVIKELVGTKDLSPANALIQSSTMIAILGGNLVAGELSEQLAGRLWVAGFWYMGFATLGWLASLRIEKLPAADSGRALSWNPWVEFRNHWRATDGSGDKLSLLSSTVKHAIEPTDTTPMPAELRGSSRPCSPGIG